MMHLLVLAHHRPVSGAGTGADAAGGAAAIRAQGETVKAVFAFVAYLVSTLRLGPHRSS